MIYLEYYELCIFISIVEENKIIVYIILQDKITAAKELYEKLLESPNLPGLVKGNVLRQLGKLILSCSLPKFVRFLAHLLQSNGGDAL